MIVVNNLLYIYFSSYELTIFVNANFFTCNNSNIIFETIKVKKNKY